MHVALNKHKHLPLSMYIPIAPKTPDTTAITTETVVVTPTEEIEGCVKVVFSPRKQRPMLPKCPPLVNGN